MAMAKTKAKKNRASGQLPIELVLPATSANLGPAFDAAALAFDLFLKVRARTAPEFSITAPGRDPEICGRVENHLILTTYREVLQAEGKPVPRACPEPRESDSHWQRLWFIGRGATRGNCPGGTLRQIALDGQSNCWRSVAARTPSR